MGGEVRGEGERSRGMGGKLGARERGVERWGGEVRGEGERSREMGRGS